MQHKYFYLYYYIIIVVVSCCCYYDSRVINPPGGKCNINIFEELPETTSALSIRMNKCQEERTRSNVFSYSTNDRMVSPKPVNINEAENESPKSSPTKQPSSPIDYSSLPGIFPSSMHYPEKIKQKRHSQLAIKNTRSHIFDS